MSRVVEEELEELDRWKWLCGVGTQYLIDRLYAVGKSPKLPKLNDWQHAMLQEQVSFQSRCARRFPNAERWIWTDKSLSQASDFQSAQFKAALIPKGRPIVDGCCGAGADTVALSAQGPTIGVDLDPINLEIAKVNTEQNSRSSETQPATFLCDRIPESLNELAEENTWLHLDPDRRPRGKKSTFEDDFSPSIQQLLPAVARAEGALIKVSPSTDFLEETQEELIDSAKRLWIGVGSECRQQVLLFGEARNALSRVLKQQGLEAPEHAIQQDSAGRVAVLLPSLFADSNANDGNAKDSNFNAQDSSQSTLPPTPLACFAGIDTSALDSTEIDVSESVQPGDVLFDLHATLHGSDLAVDWAGQHGLSALGDLQGYFHASDRLPPTPWTQQFRVLDVESWDDRKIRKRLRALKPSSVEVKARRVKIDANLFQRRYQSLVAADKGRAIVLLTTRIGQRVKCFFCERLA